jgi:hypothetical protein
MQDEWESKIYDDSLSCSLRYLDSLYILLGMDKKNEVMSDGLVAYQLLFIVKVGHPPY